MEICRRLDLTTAGVSAHSVQQLLDCIKLLEDHSTSVRSICYDMGGLNSRALAFRCL